jgi:hypothetical protein
VAQVRNVSNDKLRVPHVARTVEPDELLDVADRDFVDRSWHRDLWELVDPPATGFDVSIDDAIVWSSTEPEPEPGPEPEPERDAPATPSPVDPPESTTGSTDDEQEA